MEAWERHIEGAAALVKLRGADQLQTDLGLRLFVAARNQVVRKTLSENRDIQLKLIKF